MIRLKTGQNCISDQVDIICRYWIEKFLHIQGHFTLLTHVRFVPNKRSEKIFLNLDYQEDEEEGRKAKEV